jgi:hypothetical protein
VTGKPALPIREGLSTVRDLGALHSVSVSSKCGTSGRIVMRVPAFNLPACSRVISNAEVINSFGLVPGVQCLKNLLRTSGQNSFATLNKVSRAICCPHLFALLPNDRSAAG